jgi:D-alanyl-D-alanine carboxypeptidase/D-alanyl-D-alanine-endopeptidase (penicillin-binding protein 4)
MFSSTRGATGTGFDYRARDRRKHGPTGLSFDQAGPIFPRRRLLRALAASALALAVSAPPAGAVTDVRPLAKRLAGALAVPHVNQARSSALAVDLATGEVVFSRRPDFSLAPASTEKLTLAYALLRTFGPAYRLETHVLGAGHQDETTWRGDLVLRGEGDPTLSTRSLTRLATQIRDSGIRRVTGAVVGDESLFDGRRVAHGWKPSYYIAESPPLSALVVDRGMYRGRPSRNPALAAASSFRAALRSVGVRVARPSRVGGPGAADIELAGVASQPLHLLLRAVNRDSDNFTAELLLKHLGAVQTGKGTTAAGARVVAQSLDEAGVPLAGVRIVDGSGLSLLDRLTAHALVSLLTAVWDDALLRGSFLSTLAVAGRNGTLEDRMTGPPVAGRVFAKTGTTGLASTLAGYVGRRYAFALLHNGPPLSPWWARRAQDRFVGVLAAE